MHTLTERISLIIAILAADPTDDLAVSVPLLLKVEHTACVAENCRQLATEAQRSARNVELAERIGWCHDLGRFPQFRRYRTFDDSKSVDHARLSLLLVNSLGLDRDLTPKEKGMLWASIYLHNRPFLPPSLPAELNFFASLLRDADRLDIFRVFKEYYAKGPEQNSPLELNYPDTGEITPAVANAILSGHSPRYEVAHSVQDMRLIKLSWAYDLKTPGALALFHASGIVEATRSVLPKTKEVMQILETIQNWQTS